MDKTEQQKEFKKFWEKEEPLLRGFIKDEQTLETMRLLSNSAFLSGVIFGISDN